VRKRVVAAALIAVVLAGAAAWRLLRVSELAQIGAGYTAEQMCDCLFISHRTQESCRSDLEPLAQKIVSVRVGPDRVTATALLISQATARYEKPVGCSLRD
jgi:hypothetical protein